MSANTDEEMTVKPIDITKLKLERGQTPEDIKQRCFDLSKDYLGGVWLKLSIDEVEVRRLSGGLTNQLYYCAVNEDKRISDAKEPQEVAIRLYNEKHFNNLDKLSNERLTDTIIAQMVSRNGLGPQIYGLFTGGQIQKYYKHKSFRTEEQKDPDLVNELAKRLARIHAMDVPIKRNGNWIFDYFDDQYKVSNERFNIKALIEESKSETLKTYDLAVELEWLKKTLISLNSPWTFTHIDFRGSNIMITETDGIVLCDFEYSSYGYRGYDFGTIFVEWGRVWGQWDKPHEFPSDETIRPFIESYIKESAKLSGNRFTKDNRNSLEHILKEVKTFSLVSVMFIILFLLKMNESIIQEIPFNKLQSMASIERQYKVYHKFKQLFAEQNVFKTDVNNNKK